MGLVIITCEFPNSVASRAQRPFKMVCIAIPVMLPRADGSRLTTETQS